MRRLALLALVVAVCSSCTSLPWPTSPNTQTKTPIKTPAPSAVAAVIGGIHHLDAHDGGIVQVAGMFYEYGTAYDCGFQWQVPGTRWCGFRMYSSTDLRTWRDRGLMFDPSSWQGRCAPAGCFRPHVVHNDTTGRFVLWFNAADRQQYVVFTAPSPAGPWQHADDVELPPSGDEALFVDSDGSAYLVRTDLAGRRATARTHELVVERLDATYTRVIATMSRPPVGFVEAPSLWRHDGVYYLAYSDPACPYCTGTGTSVMQARSLAGPWSRPYSISARSCGGQPTMVSVLELAGRPLLLVQSDRWVRLGSDRITRNQARATQAWVPAAYDASGRIAPLACPSASG